jgi:hypothetical protein
LYDLLKWILKLLRFNGFPFHRGLVISYSQKVHQITKAKENTRDHQFININVQQIIHCRLELNPKLPEPVGQRASH